jgi:hypothetical protein
MVKDYHDRVERQTPMSKPAFRWTGLGLATAGVLVVAGFLMARWLPASGGALAPGVSSGEHEPLAGTTQTVSAGPPANARLFQNWPKQDVALVLSGQEFGYLQPCGCSYPQKGGLARRYNFMQALIKEHGWPVVAADLGDIPQRNGPQALLKYRISMEALKVLTYTAVGIGENETAMPLFNALGEFALNNQSPRVVAANLANKNANFPGMVASWEVSANAEGPRVGFIGVVGPSVAAQVQDPGVRFHPVDKTLPEALQQIQAQKNPEILVLLYQGLEKEAEACARRFPQFHIILCASKEEEPSSQAAQVGNTKIISVGHKGRYVGVVGAKRTATPGQFELRYELVALDPEYETPQDHDQDNPIHALLQKYAKEVKDDNYLAKYVRDARHPLQVAFPEAAYVGSERCKKCHETAYEIWKNSPHPHAFVTLVTKAKRPTLRQYDGECILCHVTGFGYKTGYVDDQTTPKLKGVGCESCHGPASLHAKNPDDAKLRDALNPWKANAGKDRQAIFNRIDKDCQRCHDPDNDVHFKFEEYWEKKKIAHYTPNN